MLDHHLQRSIVYRLAHEHSLRFSDLKPDIIDNKLFTYHLRKVIVAGYVKKDYKGQYILTSSGRRLGVRVLESQQALMDHAYSVLFLVIRRKQDKAWLLYRRRTHPLIDRVGFMHCVPNSLEATVQTAAHGCLEKTGMTVSFRALGGGYFRVYDNKTLESFTHFSLLVGENATGQLIQNDPDAEYFWEKNTDFSDVKMLPNMPILAELYAQNKTFFIERSLNL